MTTVYISATQEDLRECRAVVIAAARRLGFEVVAMEDYVAEGRPPLEKCLEDVGQCDVYVGLFAWRNGYTPPGSEYSITEAEYREAVRLGKHCLVFLLAKEARWPGNLIDHGVDGERIVALRKELTQKHLCTFFTDAADLGPKASAALQRYQNTYRGRDTGQARPSQSGGELSAEIRLAYCSQLSQRYRRVELDALIPQPAVDFLSIPLTDVFVEPTAREDAPPEMPRDWWDGLPGVNSAEAAALREAHQAKSSALLFDIVADPQHRTVVLLGDPGAGKSAVTRQLTMILTGSHDEPRLAALAGFLPFLVELRSYASHIGDHRCENFLDYLDHRCDSDPPGIKKDVLQPYLRGGGKALFLFDGLDEIFEPGRREEVVSQIVAFAAEFPAVRVLVTSRIIGYSRGRLADAGFVHFTIDDFGDAQIDQFLRGWCEQALPNQPVAAANQRQRILNAIRTFPAIRELAGNPLLLTILAIIGRDKVLPQERWRLYDHAATVLIMHWSVRQTGVVPLDLFAKKELLRRLAYQMQARDSGGSGNYIEHRQLLRVFEDYLVERFQGGRDRASVMAQAMIDQLHERNFILGRYGPDRYGFVHRTFLEFFCADEIVEKFQRGDRDMSMDRIRELFRQHWAEPSWREVLRLVIGRLPGTQADALITLLATGVNTPWPPEEFAAPPWNLALAVQCVAEVRDPATIASAAQILLRQLILLIEHGVSIEDRNTVELTEAEILPAVRVIGTRWPARGIYLYWYHRRGVRVSWMAGSSFATRVAVMLATPEQCIEDFMAVELAATNDRRALYALVAGLAEAADLANRSDHPGSPGRRARCRALLTERARDDEHGAIRQAALQALITQFGAEARTSELLLERAGTDPYAGVRLLCVETLSAGRIDAPLRALLLNLARSDPDNPVRRAAVEALGRLTGDKEVRQLLLDRLRTELDPGVLQTAFRALLDGFDTGNRLRQLLLGRIYIAVSATPRERNDRTIQVPYDSVRRTAVRLLAEAYPDMRYVLEERTSGDPDPRTRSVALHELIRTAPADADLRDLLVERIEHDDDSALRLAALRILIDRYGAEPWVRTLLTGRANDDRNAAVRLTAVQELDRLFGDIETVDLLIELATGDTAAGVRLAATQALAEHFGADQRTRELLLAQTSAERDTIVRLAATRALIRIGPDPRIHERLLGRVAHDPDPQIVREAATELLIWPDQRDRVAAVLSERAREASYGGVRLVAVELLGTQIPDDLLFDRAELDPDPMVFQAAVSTLINRSADQVRLWELLLERAADLDATVRLAAVSLLGDHFRAGPEVPGVLLTTARNDPDVQVRRAAVDRLGARLADHDGVRAALVELLDDPDWSIRRTALHALGQHFGADDEIRALIKNRARTDPDAEFRRMAGQTLTWLPGAHPDDLPDALT